MSKIIQICVTSFMDEPKRVIVNFLCLLDLKMLSKQYFLIRGPLSFVFQSDLDLSNVVCLKETQPNLATFMLDFMFALKVRCHNIFTHVFSALRCFLSVLTMVQVRVN